MLRVESTKQDEIEECRSNVKEFVTHIENPGKQLILTSLTQHGKDPLKSIVEIQESLSIGFVRCNTAFQLLDAFGVSRLQTHVSLLESLKDNLLQAIQSMNEDNLVVMLKQTYQFMRVHDLKAVPVAILKRLHRIPDEYLEYLLNKNYISVCRSTCSS